jgi:hypothetical protein
MASARAHGDETRLLRMKETVRSSEHSSMIYRIGRCLRPFYVMCLSRTILVLGFLFVVWQSYNSEWPQPRTPAHPHTRSSHP